MEEHRRAAATRRDKSKSELTGGGGLGYALLLSSIVAADGSILQTKERPAGPVMRS